jgi:AraC-like DNA-binding protein
VAARFRELCLALERTRARLAADSLLLDVFALLVGRHAAEPPPPEPAGREGAAVRRARDHLNEAYADNVSLEELARLAGIGPFALSRAFRAEVGMPPHAFLTHVRILRAKALLRAGASPAEAAARTGFVDQSHLSRHFKRLVKLTPGRFAAASKNVQSPVPPV